MSEVAKYASQVYFQNSLAEVVCKLRSSSTTNEEAAIEQFIKDTKDEIGSTVQSVKVAAIQKAMYFHMLGYSSAYASFHIVEVMADTIFAKKRIGYAAACATFGADTDVLPLTTALLQRDLRSSSQYEIGLALYCVASVCTPDLARDVVADVVRLLSHPRTYVRKKAVLSLYKVFIQYPESLRPTYPLLKGKLEDGNERCDTDTAVRGAVVCVLCELARRNPTNYLGLAVPFYALLSSVHSNWILIKIVKVFGYFTPLEPRLGKKLVEPLTNLITTTAAKSVQYECLLAVANGMGKVPALTKLALEKLKYFIEDSDQNLKFLGLDAMSRMVGENPKLIAPHRAVMLQCLDDPDPTIRLKALGILRDLASRKNMVSTINSMCDKCVRTPPEDEWSNAVVETVIEAARTDDYAFVEDFEWYLGVLLDLCVANIDDFRHGALLEEEIVEILTRVPGVRQSGVEWLSVLLANDSLFSVASGDEDVSRGKTKSPSASSCCSTQWCVLRAAAFACGEFPHWLVDPRATCRRLLCSRTALLPADGQSAFLSAVAKIGAFVFSASPRHVELSGGEEQCALPERVPCTYTELKACLMDTHGDNVRNDTEDEDDCGYTSRSSGSSVRKEDYSEVGDDKVSRTLFSRFCRSAHPAVQERASLVHYQLFVSPILGPSMYGRELAPVAAGAQRALGVPEEIDLSAPFCENAGSLMPASQGGEAGRHGGVYGDDMNTFGGDEEDEDEGDDDFSLEYNMEQQRRREEQRRREVSAFYISGSAAPSASSTMLDEASAGTHRATTEATVSFRHRVRTSTSGDGKQSTQAGDGGEERGKKKTFLVNRELSKPDSYKPEEAAGRGGAAKRRSHSAEEDEATLRLRNIDVTRALSAHEVLPVAVPYSTRYTQQLQQVQHQAQHPARDGNNKSNSAGGDVVEPPLPSVQLHDADLVRVVITVNDCRVRRDGTRLSCGIEVYNLSSASTMHELQVEAGVAEGSGKADSATRSMFVEPAEAEKKVNAKSKHRPRNATVAGAEEVEDGKNVEQPEEEAVAIASRVKCGSVGRATIVLRFTQLPASFTEEPFPLALRFVRDKKSVTIPLAFFLCYVYFARPSRHAGISSSHFLSNVLEDSLKEAEVFSAFFPCRRANMLLAVPVVQQRLRLVPVDVLKDAMSLHGLLQARKGDQQDAAHVAVLLREITEDGERGVSVSVRAQEAALATALIEEVASIVDLVSE